MKKEFGLALLALFFLSLNAITGAYAVENENKDKNIKKINTIIKQEVDVSGDGKPDTIEIKGIRYEEGSSYFKDIYLEIIATNGQTYKTRLDSGFDPTLEFVDLNQDGLADMFISIPTGGSGGISNYFLYTLKDFQLKEIGAPDPLMITSEFQDDYKAIITIDNTGESVTFDVMSRKKEYERLGLYQKGKLNEPRELMVDPYSTLKPVIIKNDSNGLKGVQQISGAYHADGIAFIESTWYYENEKWNLIRTKVIEREQN
ncbi:hypothetical protein JMM81_15610 [Bacillus sp. V3B]|uniref:hypothetical protein n=1 Tax=Bacillus sp. V3B TaxID=2804915 RepID=UPI00210A9DE2|nr:hypothetical protein [Bacillus sp. V3B]MCQ6276343.1 hypothetical protein [Bacillus sp. V3B]